MFKISSVSCNAGSESLAPFPDCTVDHSLIKTVPLLNVLAQLFHILDLISVNRSCRIPTLHNQLEVSVLLPSTRQHLSYGDCLEVKREYYHNSSVLDCVTQCSQSAAHLYEQFLQVKQIGFITLGPLRCA